MRLRRSQLAISALDEALGLYKEIGPGAGFHDALLALAELALRESPQLAATALEVCRQLHTRGVFELTSADVKLLENIAGQLGAIDVSDVDQIGERDAPRWAHEELSRLSSGRPWPPT